MEGFYQNGEGCQEGMRAKISGGEKALKGPLKFLSSWLDFVEVNPFPANPILPTPEGKIWKF